MPDSGLTSMQRLVTLRTFSGFARMPATEVASFAEHTRERFFPANTVIARAGDPARAAYFIVSGAIQVNVDGRPGRTMRARDVVGGLSWLARDPDTPELVAVEDTYALEILTEDLEDIYEDSFPILSSVLGSLARQHIKLRRELGPGAGFDRAIGGAIACPARPLDLVERVFFLRRSISFAQTRIEAIAQLARDAEEIRAAAGTFLWREGAAPDRVLYPICGVVRGTTRAGQEFRFHPGASIGSLDILVGEPRWFTAAFEEDAVALALDGERLLDLLEDHFDIAREYVASLATVLIDLWDKRAMQPDERIVYAGRRATTAAAPATS